MDDASLGWETGGQGDGDVRDRTDRDRDRGQDGGPDWTDVVASSSLPTTTPFLFLPASLPFQISCPSHCLPWKEGTRQGQFSPAWGQGEGWRTGTDGWMGQGEDPPACPTCLPACHLPCVSSFSAFSLLPFLPYYCQHTCTFCLPVPALPYLPGFHSLPPCLPACLGRTGWDQFCPTLPPTLQIHSDRIRHDYMVFIHVCRHDDD